MSAGSLEAVLDWAGATDVGRVRSSNEDSLLAEPPLFVVADGMGGHASGDIASSLTVERLRTLGGGGPISLDLVSSELRNINSLLRDAGDADSPMGTTGVGLVMVSSGGAPSWLVFNVGDSRAYCLADGELHQISRDHSYVQELVDAGTLAPQDISGHPHRHVVTRALGVDQALQADYWVRPLKPGERFLLCSDGLTGEVDDAILAEVLGSGRSAADTVATLVDLALRAGGRDNVTAVVVDVVSVPGWDDATTGGREAGAAGPPDLGGDPTAEADVDTAERTLRYGPPAAPPAAGPPEPEEVIGVAVPPTPRPASPPERVVSEGSEIGSRALPVGRDVISWVPAVDRTPGASPEAAPAEAAISDVPRSGIPVTSEPAGPTPTLIEALPRPLAVAPGGPIDPDARWPVPPALITEAPDDDAH